MEVSADNKLRSFFLQYPSSIFNKDEIITRPIDNRQGVYYIREGYVKMYTHFYEGREFTLNIFKPGSYFSITAILSGLPDHNYYKAISRVNVHYAQEENIIDFLKQNPDVLYGLTTRLSLGFQAFLSNLNCILNGSAYDRVVSVLIALSKRFSRETPKGQLKITLRLTHQEIANMANLSRETTSVELKNLERDNIISYKGSYFTIVDYKRLQELAGSCEQSNFQGELKTF